VAALGPSTVLTGHAEPLTGDDLTFTLLDAADRY
jgi:hypothetical protein